MLGVFTVEFLLELNLRNFSKSVYNVPENLLLYQRPMDDLSSMFHSVLFCDVCVFDNTKGVQCL